MFHKSIFQGCLQFNNAKSFDKASNMYKHRVENYYKPNEIIFEHDDIFLADALQINIPRTVINITEKSWKSTVDILTYVAQFAVAGNVGAWMNIEGKLRHYGFMEPKSDKRVVQSFLKGKDFAAIEGKEEEALEALNKTISLYDKHAQAYERRGFVNLMLGNLEDAHHDFSKSIENDPDYAPGYYGRARIDMRQGKYEKALKDLDIAIKKSLALQDVHWTARRLKAVCLLRFEQYEKAEFELRFFSKRTFNEGSKNTKYQKHALTMYGETLLALNRPEEAIEMLNKALEVTGNQKKVDDGEIYALLGKAKKDAGKNGFLADWKRAIEAGNKEAEALLADHRK